MQVLVYALVWLVLTAGVALRQPALMSFDAQARQAIRLPDLLPFWLTVTDAGDPVVMFGFFACLLAVFAAWRQWERFKLVAGAILAVALLRWGVLWLVERARPTGAATEAFGWSYPSGHTAYSLTAALVVYLLVEPTLRKPWQHTVLLTLTVAWPVCVALSRVQVGVHWPIDVLAGWLLPLIIVPVMVNIANREAHR